jgi:hypothetical protein
VRLLTPSSPSIIIPKDQNNLDAIQNADSIEKIANAILLNAGRVRGDPVHFDIMRNAVTFDEVHIGMSSTNDLLRDIEKRLKEEKDKSKRRGLEADLNRAKAVRDNTPYLIDVFDPRGGYPEWDRFGLESYLRVYETTVRELISKFGENVLIVLDKKRGQSYQPYQKVRVMDYFDNVYHQIWLEGNDEPLLQEAHELPFIPIVAEIIQGSKQGESPMQQRKPALYNYWKSGMWHADNLFFTIVFSNIFAMLSMPPFLNEQIIDGEVGKPEIDFDAKPPNIDVPYGRKLSQMQMKVVTPDIMALHDLAQSKGIESTMYRQMMGEPLPGSPSYSLVAFLAQNAKTVLNTVVEKTQWIVADVAKMGLKWMKHDEGTYSVRYEQQKVSLMSSDIPKDDFLVECKLAIKTPQDIMGASQIVAQLAQIPELPLSLGWMVENLLGVENLTAERERKWSEQQAAMDYQKFIQQQMMAEQQMQMQAQQAQQQQMQNAGAASEEQAAMMGAVPGMQGEPGAMGTPPEMTGVPEAPPGTAGTVAAQGMAGPPVMPPIPGPGGGV